MIYQVDLSNTFTMPVEATSPVHAACSALEHVERQRNEFDVGCGGRERALVVHTPTERVVVVVSGRMVPTYSGEIQR